MHLPLAASNIFELAQNFQAGKSEAFDRIFRLRAGSAACQVNQDLSKRFGEALHL